MLPKTPKVPSVLPNRYYTGFKAPPSACCVVEGGFSDASKKSYLVVGTLQGTLEIVAIEKGAIPKIKFEHKTETQINVIGLISSNPKTEIFVQFRGEEVLFFHLNFLENNEVEFVKTKSIGLSHFGFCQSLWDSQTRRLFIPGKVDDTESLSISYENGGEKIISFGAEFLFSSFKKRHPETDLTQDACFHGTISGIQQIKETINYEERDRLLIGFEDATLLIYDIRTKEVINLFKAPAKFSQLVGFAVNKDAEVPRWRIAVSVISRIFEVVYENESFELTKRIKKTGFANVNCSHITFNASGDKLICGYSSGRIEFYSVPNYEIFKVMNFHEASILCLKVSTHNEDDETMFTGDEDGQLSQMSMKKLDDT